MIKEKKKKTITSWVLQVLLAGLFLMAAVPKLTGDPMAAEMVAKLGLGTWAAYVIGATEAITAVLLLVPRTAAYGAILAVAVLAGAILAHLTALGISLGEEDGGSMFAMAAVGLVLGGFLAWLRRQPLLSVLTGKEVKLS